MGVLNVPRVNFRGAIHWNPSTINNNDYLPTYDPANAKLNQAWAENRGLECAEDFDRFVTTPMQAPDGTSLAPVEWNYYGGMEWGFVASGDPVIEWPAKFSKPNVETVVTGFTNAKRHLVSDDPWCGLPVQISPGPSRAKLVDVNPLAFYSTQIFVDRFVIGDASTGLDAKVNARSHSRWIYTGRNLNLDNTKVLAGTASAVFQLGLDKADLAFRGSGSVAAQELEQALTRARVRGLMVRFVAYDTVYFQGDAFKHIPPGDLSPLYETVAKLFQEFGEQNTEYRLGKRKEPPPLPINRAYSRLVGWVGPWLDGELRTVPGARTVVGTHAVPRVSHPKDPVTIGPVEVAPVADAAAPDFVGSLAVDLGSTIPELDATCTKADLGTLVIGLSIPGASIALAQVHYAGGYDQAGYERTSGIMDIPLASRVSRSIFDNHQLSLWFEQGNERYPAGEETRLTAQTDTRAVYLDQPSPSWAPSKSPSVSVRVWQMGGPPAAGSRLCLAQYAPDDPYEATVGWQLVSSSDPSSQKPYAEIRCSAVEIGDGWVVVELPPAEPPATWVELEFELVGLRPGMPVIAFYPIPPGQAYAGPPKSVPAPEIVSAAYCACRVLPFHNLAADQFAAWLKDQPPIDLVTQKVWDEVFSAYFLLYPAMRFLRDPLTFQAYRGRILELTLPALFESPRYMPVTRDLSAGQRRQLELWKSYLDARPLPKEHTTTLRR